MSWDGLQGEAFVYLAVFCRAGTILMLMPGIGQSSVPGRIRIILALFVTVGLAQVVGQNYPAIPDGLSGLLQIVLIEIGIGLALGLIVRIFMLAVQVAGTLIATQGGLAFAQNFDPTVGVQGALIASFLSLLSTTLILQADLHHVVFIGMRNSYELFPVGVTPDMASLADLSARTFSDGFALGLQLASPFIAFSLIFYAAMGAISKLMPQLQIFFLAMPVNIMVGFIILALTLSTLMFVYLEHFEEFLLGIWG